MGYFIKQPENIHSRILSRRRKFDRYPQQHISTHMKRHRITLVPLPVSSQTISQQHFDTVCESAALMEFLSIKKN